MIIYQAPKLTTQTEFQFIALQSTRARPHKYNGVACFVGKSLNYIAGIIFIAKGGWLTVVHRNHYSKTLGILLQLLSKLNVME